MKKSILLTLAALFAATAAFAAQGAHPSQEQIDAGRAELFSASDVDGDGSLGIAEFATFNELVQAERRERHFNHLDQDGDGLVSTQEFESSDHPRPRRGHR